MIECNNRASNKLLNSDEESLIGVSLNGAGAPNAATVWHGDAPGEPRHESDK